MSRIALIDDFAAKLEILSAPLAARGYEMQTSVKPIDLEQIIQFNPDLIVVALCRRTEAFNRPIEDLHTDVMGIEPLVQLEQYPAIETIPIMLLGDALVETDIPTTLHYNLFLSFPKDFSLYFSKVDELAQGPRKRRRMASMLCPHCAGRLSMVEGAARDLFCLRCHTAVSLFDDDGCTYIVGGSGQAQSCRQADLVPPTRQPIASKPLVRVGSAPAKPSSPSPDELMQAVSGAAAFINQDLVIVSVNPAFARLFNVTPEKLVGRPVMEALPDGRHMGVVLAGALSTCKDYTAPGETFVVFDETGRHETHWDVSHRVVSTADHQVLGVLVQATDVTASIHLYGDLKARLKDSTHQCEFNDRLLRDIPAAVGSLDRHMIYQMANAEFQRQYQVPLDRVVGHSLYEVFPEARERFGPIMQAILKTGNPFRARSFPFTYAVDGHTKTTYWDLAFHPILDGEARVTDILWFSVDVTQRVEMECIQRERIASLEDLNRMKTEFLATASHELRTPLTSIQGFSEFLDDEVAGMLEPQQREFVHQIQEGASRLQRLINDLLDAARLEAGAFRLMMAEADMVAVVKRTVDALVPQSEKAGISLHAMLPAGSLNLEMDVERIEQVIVNLVGNAIKFIPRGGEVVVSARAEADDVVVEVQDNGPGIPPEKLGHIFERFYQVDAGSTRAYGGAGLGLSIARAIVEAHGGTMGVMSEPGKGSRFYFVMHRKVVARRERPSDTTAAR